MGICSFLFEHGLSQNVYFHHHSQPSPNASLDELWLTHNISKAVAHAEPVETDGIAVNSIVEDTFHVCNSCFARAVNSQSSFAMEATANHVAGFVSDGFFDILHQLARKDAPVSVSVKVEEPTRAKLAANSVASSSSSATSTTCKLSPAFVEALNTLVW
jgi:hypothetical protein